MSERTITPGDPPPDHCEWRTVTVNDNYEISEYGHLRRRVGGSNSKAGRLLKARLAVGNGYYKYSLCRDHRYTTHLIHRLVALAFIGRPPEDKPQVAHYDGVKSNCHYSNLRWASAKENSDDRERHGRTYRGSVHPCYGTERPEHRGSLHVGAKLTEDAVRQILRSSEKQRDLASEYGVDQALIQRIRAGKAWRHITAPEASQAKS